MRRAIVAGALLAFASGTALAQDDNERGFYAGAGIGQFNFEDDVDGLGDFDDEVEDFSIDDDDNSWKVFAGYRFLPWLSAELNYVDFGRTQDEFETGGSSGDYTAELSGIQPALVATLPLGPVELSARVGYLFYDIDLELDIDDLSDPESESSSDEALSYGVGVGVTLFQHLAAKIEYEEFDVDGVQDASAYWLSAAWRF